jgi:hypothetical protein
LLYNFEERHVYTLKRKQGGGIMTTTAMAGTATMPKSYLSAAEREELMREDDIELVYHAEYQAAEQAGDDDAAWAWLALEKLPAYTLLFLKRQRGARFIREMGFDTTEADAEYGLGWLDRDDNL